MKHKSEQLEICGGIDEINLCFTLAFDMLLHTDINKNNQSDYEEPRDDTKSNTP